MSEQNPNLDQTSSSPIEKPALITHMEAFLLVAEEFRRRTEPYIEAINEGGDASEKEISTEFNRLLLNVKESISLSKEIDLNRDGEHESVQGLRKTFEQARQALSTPIALIPSSEWGGRKDMMCPGKDDEVLDFNASGWSAEVLAFGPLGVQPASSVVLTEAAVESIQQGLNNLFQAALAKRDP